MNKKELYKAIISRLVNRTILQVIFILFTLFLLIPSPSTTFAFGAEKDILNVNIEVRGEWELGQTTNIMETGSASLHISGTIERVEKDGEVLKYKAKALTGCYTWNNKWTYHGDDECAGLLSTEQGAGTRPIDSDKFRMTVYLGELGNKVAKKKGCTMPVSGVYEFSVQLKFQTNIIHHQRKPCEYPIGVSSMRRSISFAGHKTLDPWGMGGSYRYTFKPIAEFMGGNLDFYVFDYCGNTKFYLGPSLGPVQMGPPLATVQGSWQIGKIKPIVRIWMKSAEGSRDITDTQPKEVSVIVGKKVQLEAVVLPAGDTVQDGKWDIPKKDIIAGYEADENHAKVTYLTEEDYKKKTIDFSWIKGTFEGAPKKVKYSGKIGNETVEAETTINVYAPKVIKRKMIPTKNYTLGPFGKEAKCALILGKLVRIQPPGGEPAMEISHEIKMPLVEDDAHLLQYVQRIKEDILYYESETYKQRMNAQWCLDTHYPYNNMEPVPWKVDCHDIPYSELGDFSREVHELDVFETYLMFIPSNNKDDKNAAWVPLEVIYWNAAAGVIRIKDRRSALPCDKQFSLLYKVLPRPHYESFPKHPEWSCNSDDNQKEVKGFDYNDEDKKFWETETSKRSP
jgi:hypothetical protein